QSRFSLFVSFGVNSEDVFGLSLPYALDREPGDWSDMYGDRNNTPGRRVQRTLLVEPLFLGSGIFHVALLLFEPHVAAPQLFFQFWSDALTKTGKRKCLYVNSEGARQNRLCLLVLPIFFNSYRLVFG